MTKVSSRATNASPPDPFYDLSFSKVWSYLKRAPLSFILLNFYLFFEYVRPQSIYSAIRGWPFAQWILIFCALAYLFEGKSVRRPWTAIDTFLLLFTIIVVASCFTAWDPGYSFANLQDYLTWVLIYLMITTMVNDERRFIVYMLGFMLWSLKMSQHAVRTFAAAGFRFQTWGATGAPGWFQNSGEMAIQMCIFLPMSFYLYQGLKPWLSRKVGWFLAALPVTAIIAVLASSSRGGQMAGALVILLMALASKHRAKAMMWVGAVGVLVALLLPPEQWERFEAMGDDQTSQARLTYWRHGREIIRQYPVLGIGYDNWLPYYRTHYDPKGELPHNIFIEAGSELGLIGLGAFVLLILATFWVNHRTRKLAKAMGDSGRLGHNMALSFDMALVGFMAGGYFVTVLYYPFMWINLAFTVALHGTVARKYAWHRRSIRAAPPETQAAVPSRTVAAHVPIGVLNRGGPV